MRSADRALSVAQMKAALRVSQGEDAEVVSEEMGVSSVDLLHWLARLQVLFEKESRKQARKEVLEATREPIVEDRVRRYLATRGFSVATRRGLTGPDVVAVKDGKTLLAEVKGDRPGHVDSPGTVNVDVLTLLGQIVMAKAQCLADEYAVAVRPVRMRLLEKALPLLRELSIKMLVVRDDDIQAIENTG